MADNLKNLLDDLGAPDVGGGAPIISIKKKSQVSTPTIAPKGFTPAGASRVDRHNNPIAAMYAPAFAKLLDEAGIPYNKGDAFPTNEGGSKYATLGFPTPEAGISGSKAILGRSASALDWYKKSSGKEAFQKYPQVKTPEDFASLTPAQQDEFVRLIARGEGTKKFLQEEPKDLKSLLDQLGAGDQTKEASPESAPAIPSPQPEARPIPSLRGMSREQKEAFDRYSALKKEDTRGLSPVGTFLQSLAKTGTLGAEPYMQALIPTIQKTFEQEGIGALLPTLDTDKLKQRGELFKKEALAQRYLEGLREQENPKAAALGNVAAYFAPSGGPALLQKGFAKLLPQAGFFGRALTQGLTNLGVGQATAGPDEDRLAKGIFDFASGPVAEVLPTALKNKESIRKAIPIYGKIYESGRAAEKENVQESIRGLASKLNAGDIIGAGKALQETVKNVRGGLSQEMESLRPVLANYNNTKLSTQGLKSAITDILGKEGLLDESGKVSKEMLKNLYTAEDKKLAGTLVRIHDSLEDSLSPTQFYQTMKRIDFMTRNAKGPPQVLFGRVGRAAKQDFFDQMAQVPGASTDISKIQQARQRYAAHMEILDRLGPLAEKDPEQIVRAARNELTGSFLQKAVQTNPEFQSPLGNVVLNYLTSNAESPKTFARNIESFGREPLKKTLGKRYKGLEKVEKEFMKAYKPDQGPGPVGSFISNVLGNLIKGGTTSGTHYLFSPKDNQ